MSLMYQTARIHSLKKYFLEGWNVIDLFTIFMFMNGFGLRFKSFQDTFDWPRVVLAINFVAFFFRLVHIFSVHKILGPKLIIIKQMVQDLLYFLMIMAVFILSYAIASFSILFPDSPVTWKTARQIIRKPYWHLYGELFLDETEADCTHDASIWKNGTFPRCPSETGRIVVPIMMAVYLLFANILLLNLLIAMFSYTFHKIHEQSDKVGCFQRCYVIREYAMRPFLCPPFNVFWHMYQLIQWCRCRNEEPYDPFHIPYDSTSRHIIWRDFLKEAVCRYVASLKQNEAESHDSRIQKANKKLDHLKTKGEEEEKFRHQAFEALNKKIDDLEKKAERESIELRRIVLILLEKIDALSKKNDDETKPDTEQQMKERTQM
ncbi:hypothetical protein DPMN_150211 [Dreissena polymorpha]|uniref:Ion transport domain-containing protein n=1 Tax=Dreissena polymorpha TaxID=45954 RepID=A0A9D4J636_DREPO|nr:hypothetical protein DPMN_150211 [Dreissena polymorpha]